jgi:hypothetical protein
MAISVGYSCDTSQEREVLSDLEELARASIPCFGATVNWGQQAVFIDLSAYLVAQLPHIAAVWLCLSVASLERYW